jgi:hypothetical protein
VAQQLGHLLAELHHATMLLLLHLDNLVAGHQQGCVVTREGDAGPRSIPLPDTPCLAVQIYLHHEA